MVLEQRSDWVNIGIEIISKIITSNNYYHSHSSSITSKKTLKEKCLKATILLERKQYQSLKTIVSMNKCKSFQNILN